MHQNVTVSTFWLYVFMRNAKELYSAVHSVRLALHCMLKSINVLTESGPAIQPIERLVYTHVFTSLFIFASNHILGAWSENTGTAGSRSLPPSRLDCKALHSPRNSCHD